VAGVDSAKGHVLTGSGPGTFQLDWLPRAHIYGYITNAHNLYVETYTELGLIGLLLLALFILGVLGASIWAVITSRDHDRTRAAGVAAALLAFFVGAAFDWLWQVPVLVSIVLLLTATVVTPVNRTSAAASSEPRQRRWRLGPQRLAGVAAALIGLAGLVAIAYPLSDNSQIADSQTAVNVGNDAAALKDARNAVSIEPGSAEAQIQLALVLEQEHDFRAALVSAERAVRDENQNWTNWLTLSRLEAENGNAAASVRAYGRARSLNPESSLFNT
jgi:tetratricopeptide (TPR) repeat protein